jgi:hypothetical protein
MSNSYKLITVFFIFLFGTVNAQTGTSSPYSISALGELKFGGFTQHQAIGRTSRSLTDNYSFSPLNPASYANLKFTVFDVGLATGFGKIETEALSTNTRSGNFNHFAMGFPFETDRKMAVSFGTYQYSNVGYDIKNQINTDTPSYYNVYKGNGGINKVYAGYGVEVVKNLNVGINGNFNFGNIQSLTAKVYPNTDDYFSFSDETFFSYSGFDLDLGVQYSVQDTVRIRDRRHEDSSGVKKYRTAIIKHAIGATYNTQTDLNGSGYRYAETFFGRKFDQGELTPIDTLLFIDNQTHNAVKPAGFGVGYTVSNGINWSVSAEMEKNFWSEVKNELNGYQFYDNMKYGFGLSIIPNPNYSELGNYLGKIKYSAGVRYENLYYNFFNEQITELGISFGLGIPVTKVVRLEDEKIPIVSRINITGEYIKRGTTDNSLIQENYFNIGIGLNFNDKWFTKRKYR